MAACSTLSSYPIFRTRFEGSDEHENRGYHQARRATVVLKHRALERLEGQKHPRESEELRPKVVQALKVVRMRKIITTNDNE